MTGDHISIIGWRPIEAPQVVRPLSREEAGREPTDSIACASSHHTAWLWSGVSVQSWPAGHRSFLFA
jgi:hypothetical protein